MSRETLLASGTEFVIDSIKNYIDTVTSGLYMGLFQSFYLLEDYQLPTDILESSGITGYSRIKVSGWVDHGNYLEGDSTTFTVGSGWSEINGYFIAKTSTGNDAVWGESFSPDHRGTYSYGQTVTITPRYRQS